MVAGEAQVGYLSDNRGDVYPYLTEQSDRMADGINRFCEEEGIPARMMRAHSMFYLNFGKSPIEGARDIDPSYAKAQREFYLHLLHHGVIVPGIHLAFISTAHSPEDVDRVVDAFRNSFVQIRQAGLI